MSVYWWCLRCTPIQVIGRPLPRQRAEKRQNPPHDRIRLETDVGQQPMVAQAHAQPAGQPRQREEQQQALPCEHERRRQRADVDDSDPNDGRPVKAVRPSLRRNRGRTSGVRTGRGSAAASPTAPSVAASEGSHKSIAQSAILSVIVLIAPLLSKANSEVGPKRCHRGPPRRRRPLESRLVTMNSHSAP